MSEEEATHVDNIWTSMGFSVIETTCGFIYEGEILPDTADRVTIALANGMAVRIGKNEIKRVSRYGAPAYAETVARGRFVSTDGETYIEHGEVVRPDDVDHPVWSHWELIREDEVYILRCNAWHSYKNRSVRRIPVVDLVAEPARFILEAAEVEPPLDLHGLIRALGDLLPDMPGEDELTEPLDVLVNRHCDFLMIGQLH